MQTLLQTIIFMETLQEILIVDILRVLGIVPLRIVYWNSINYFSKRLSSNTYRFIYCFFTNLIDYPIEQIKINKMLNKNFFNPMGYISLLSRNIIFAIGFAISINSIENKNYNGAVGGFVGSLFLILSIV